MKVMELHLIQTVPPSNTNRDEAGFPKSARFGGVQRMRLSSQAQKYAIRKHLEEVLEREKLAVRTRHPARALQRYLEREEDDLREALELLGLKHNKDGALEAAIFLPWTQVEALARLVEENWETLAQLIAQRREAKAKDRGKIKAPPELVKQTERILKSGTAGDMALFGRMMASHPEANVEAAAHVAHAISTHGAPVEGDFFITSDDLANKSEAGAAMMGERNFTAATFYRYAAVDAGELADNLDGDEETARAFLQAFARAFVEKLPGGMQASHAAYTLPEAVLVVVHEGEPRSLAGAFDQPVHSAQGGYGAPSARRMLRQWRDLNAMYGPQPGAKAFWVALPSLGVAPEEGDGIEARASVREALEEAVKAVMGG